MFQDYKKKYFYCLKKTSPFATELKTLVEE